MSEHGPWDGHVGHCYLGGFFAVAPWPLGDRRRALQEMESAFEAAPRTRRNGDCTRLEAADLPHISTPRCGRSPHISRPRCGRSPHLHATTPACSHLPLSPPYLPLSPLSPQATTPACSATSTRTSRARRRRATRRCAAARATGQPPPDMGRYGGDMGLYGACDGSAASRYGEIWGRYGEIWGGGG